MESSEDCDEYYPITQKHEPVTTLQVVDLLPSKLSCTVYYFDQYWIYVTEGMVKNNQAEFVLMLKLDEEEKKTRIIETDFLKFAPVGPFMLFKALWTSTIIKKFIGDGHILHLGNTQFLRPNIHGVSFQDALTLAFPHGVLKYDTPYLQVITMFDDELALCKSAGNLRVLALMGKEANTFPYPHWSDRDRKSVIPVDFSLQDSILSKAPHVNIAGSSSFLNRNERKLIINLPKNGVLKFEQELKAIAEDSVVILISHFTEVADGLILWNPSKLKETQVEELQFFSAKQGTVPNIVCSSFVGFVPEQPEDETIAFEDGFMVMLTDNSWHLLRQCISSGTNCLIQSDTKAGLNAEIKWIEDENEEAHDAHDHHNEEKSNDEPELRLMTPKKLIQERIDMQVLVEYIEKLFEHGKSLIKAKNQSTQGIAYLVLQTLIQTGNRATFKIGFEPIHYKADDMFVQELKDEFSKIPVVDSNGEVEFRLIFSWK